MSNWAPPSAQKLWVIERLTGWLHKTSPQRSRMCFRIASPAISLGQRRLSRPIAIDSAKALFEKAPIDRPRAFRERMVHIGDLAETRFEKICLPALAPLRGKGHLSLAAPRDRRGYKKNVDDMRESPALVIIEMFQRRNATVDYYDPLVPIIPPTREHSTLAGMKSVALTPAVLAALRRSRCRDGS
jgi:hypothetical protein